MSKLIFRIALLCAFVSTLGACSAPATEQPAPSMPADQTAKTPDGNGARQSAAPAVAAVSWYAGNQRISD